MSSGLALGQGIGAGTRFVDIIEVSDREAQADITIQFTCSLRYVTHLPASEGKELRIELQPLPDCGVTPGSQIVGELPPVSGGGDILLAARVDSDVPGQLTLVLNFKKSEQFVLAQGADPHNVRVRLFNRVHGRAFIPKIEEAADAASNFAINLESQPKPFDQAAIDLASQRLSVPVFVSETMVEGEKWYRLRIGPISKRTEAERLLNLALPNYPRAWIAIGDDSATSDPNASPLDGPLPEVEKIGADPPGDPSQLKKMLSDARSALSARDFPKAIGLLTKLQRQPEYPDRARAQEFLGLTYERSGQLAHAKAEYLEYLRRYPQGDAVERVTTRLRILRAASAKSRNRGEGGKDRGWQLTGGVAQLARYDSTKLDSSAPAGTTLPAAAQTTSQSALFNDVDLLARRRGERFDFLSRVSAGYSKNFGQSGGTSNDTKRISVASIEMADRGLGLLARLGRQSRNDDGVLGTFDGLYVNYQVKPSWAINATFGFPVEQTDASPATERNFQSVSLAYTPQGKHWDASVFAIRQRYNGLTDRQAMGLEARYLGRKQSLIALLDYDSKYRSMNAVSLLGTWQLPAHWNLSFDLERRNSPILTTRNALIGQPETSVTELLKTFTEPQIYELARGHTPVTSNYSLTANRPIGQRFQFSSTVSASKTGATTELNGTITQPASPLNPSIQMQLYGSSIWRKGDFSVVSLAYSKTETGRITSLGLTTRFPLGAAAAWRIGPRLTVDHRILTTDDSKETAFLPSMLLDYQRGRNLLQFELGGQIGKRDATVQSQKTTRYYISLGYRIGF